MIKILKNIKILIFIILIIEIQSIAQNKNSLEKKRKEYREKIELMNNMLKKNKKDQISTIANLKLYTKRIETRKKLVKNLENEIQEINIWIENNNLIIEYLTNDLINLKKEYEKLIYFAYRNRKLTNLWLFIFASESFNKAYRRYKYLTEYTKYRKKQKELIIAVNILLEEKNDKLIERKKSKQELLFDYSSENSKLKRELKEKENVIISLKNKEREIRNGIEENKRKEKRIEEEIAKLIKIEKKRTRQQSKTDNIISNNFRNNIGKMIWPVNNGIIVNEYGEHYHPILKEVKLNNNGIDISAEKNTEVLAIYDGEVAGIYAISGTNSTVLIKHGSFYTVYQNVIELKIKRGTKIKKGDIMGKVYTDEMTNESLLHFEIWDGKNTVDPMRWINKNY